MYFYINVREQQLELGKAGLKSLHLFDCGAAKLERMEFYIVHLETCLYTYIPLYNMQKFFRIIRA